ncbi:hypothetical protein Clacol_009139 [Clathrus columnatus]|uniref:Uncharacterized protein n=1 Tax=Clathrus columnatus TaxID=1419009 RepID=A0AAV5APX1_9AGAM|nr:hypothetical protein Clacol_009139 [Clathrus columnatus]
MSSLGFGAAFEPGSFRRTGAVGKHVIGGKSKFRILDERLKPYVHKDVRLTRAEMKQVYHGSKLLTGERLLELTKPLVRTPLVENTSASS